MGDIYIRENNNGETNIKRITAVGIKTPSGIKKAKQIYVRPGPAIISAWETNPDLFVQEHPDNNPTNNADFFKWKPVWSMIVTFHYGDGTTTTKMIPQGATIGTLPTAAAINETFSDGQTLQRTFNAWSTSSTLDSKIIDENFVITTNTDVYALYDHIVTFKDSGAILGRRVVKRHELLGDDTPVVEGKNAKNGVWRLETNSSIHYSASSRVNSDITLLPAQDIEITFNLNGSGLIMETEKFYVSTVTGEDTWGNLVANAPVPNATGYGDSYTENAEYDFVHTGKIFLGWYTAKTGGTLITEMNQTEARSGKVFYAHWKENINFTLYPLSPDGSIAVGKAKVLDTHYGNCERAQFNVYYTENEQERFYGAASVSLEDLFGDTLVQHQVFKLDSNEDWYYRNTTILNKPIRIEMELLKLYPIQGILYDEKITKTMDARWFNAQLRYNQSGVTSNFVVEKQFINWKEDTYADKLFDFNEGKIYILSSDSVTAKGPYWNINLSPAAYRNTQTDCTTSTNGHYPNLTLGCVSKPMNGQRWNRWGVDDNGVIASQTAPISYYSNVWTVSNVTKPNGDNSTLSWTAADNNSTRNESLQNQVPHHYTITGTRRSDSEKVTLATNINQNSYSVSNPENYSELFVTPYDENENYYNELSCGKLYQLTIKYSNYTSYEATGRTQIAEDEQSYLPSAYIQIKQPRITAHKVNDLQAQMFDTWIMSTSDAYDQVGTPSSYMPGSYFNNGNIFSLSADKTVLLYASYKNKYVFNGSCSVDSITKMVTWNAATDIDDSTVGPASYKIIGVTSKGTHVTLADDITNLYAVIPELDETYTSIYLVAQNSDKTIFNARQTTLNWKKITFSSTNGTQLSFATKYRLSGEVIGELPTIQSSRPDYVFDYWAGRPTTSTDTAPRMSDSNNVYYCSSTITTDMNFYPRWVQNSYTVTYSYIDEYGISQNETVYVAPTTDYHLRDDLDDLVYNDSNNQTKMLVCWTKNGVDLNSSESQTISGNTTFVARYENYFNLTTSSLNLLINGYKGTLDWSQIYSSKYGAANSYKIEAFDNNSSSYTYNTWLTLGTVNKNTTTYRSTVLSENSNFNKVRFYAIGENDEQNYIDYDLTWYAITVQDTTGVSRGTAKGLIGDEVYLPNEYEDSTPYQTTTGESYPYYVDRFNGSYKNITKNSAVSLTNDGYYIINSSDFTNRAATFKAQTSSAVFLDVPVIDFTSYDDKYVSWDCQYGEWYTLYKNGNYDATAAGTPIVEDGGAKEGQNLWYIDDIYNTEQEFDNKHYLFRVRVAAHRTVMGSEYTTYSDWVEVDGHPTIQIYGVRQGDTSTLIRTDAAANFSDPIAYKAGSTNYGSPFDNIMPWAGMTIVEREGGTMVAIPKFYYRFTEDEGAFGLQITNQNLDGFHVSPAHMDRGDGAGERDVVYVGRYHCRVSDYRSVTGEKPKVNMTRATARTQIHNLGATVWQSDFAMRVTIWMLAVVEYARFNPKTKIGQGTNNNNTLKVMGYTDSMPYHTGTTLSSTGTTGCSTQYRNIEGLWDNVYDYCDGVYIDSKEMNIILNPNDFSDNTGGISLGQNGSNGQPTYVKLVNVEGIFPWFLVTASATDGWLKLNNSGMQFMGTSGPCLYTGGCYSSSYPLLTLYTFYTCAATNTSSVRGCRLMELPLNT